MPPPDQRAAPLAALADRLGAAARSLRRGVLRRRRLLLAVLVSVAVAGGVSAVTAPPAATVTVRVAAHDLAPGEVVADSDLVEVAFRPGSEPDDVVADPVGRVLAAPVTRGEPLTAVRLVGADLVRADPGRQAVPVRLPDAGMVGLLRVGDRIDLVAADPQDGTSQVLASSVTVLALPAADPVPASGLPGRLVVVGLDVADVPDVTAAAARAFVTFAWADR